MQTRAETATVHSVNVSGALRSVWFAGGQIETGFFKSPITGRAHAHRLGLAGDAQADLSVHGGPEKAVYFYAREHYAAWEALLGTAPLAPGSFGENVTSEGWLESDLCIGDVLQIGTATLQVLQPRSPCYKLQIRFGRPDMTFQFFQQGKPGWYASVLQEGSFAAGDTLALVDRTQDTITVADIWRYSVHGTLDAATLERVQKLRLLPDFWKNRIRRNAAD